jgi:hypothetical protein
MSTYKRHRFPPDIVRFAVWLYIRFNLSPRRDAAPFDKLEEAAHSSFPSNPHRNQGAKIEE